MRISQIPEAEEVLIELGERPMRALIGSSSYNIKALFHYLNNRQEDRWDQHQQGFRPLRTSAHACMHRLRAPSTRLLYPSNVYAKGTSLVFA